MMTQKKFQKLFLFYIFLAFASLAVSVEARNKFDLVDIETLYINQQSNAQVHADGKVEKILSDDSHGSRHQRFVVRINAKLTVLISHNIDIAPRISSLKLGDSVQFYGEYEWNKKGGVVHWTHRDPKGRHVGGWLKHKGIIYQ